MTAVVLEFVKKCAHCRRAMGGRRWRDGLGSYCDYRCGCDGQPEHVLTKRGGTPA